MISSFLLLILVEVSLASQMSRQGSKKVVEQQTINKVEEQNINQEQLDWALDQLPHHRTKRFLFLTEEKRLVMPPGSKLVITPTLALPFLRYTPTGVKANMSISTPFTISFDELGLTDNKNPFGLISFLHPFIDLLSSGKKKRSIADPKLEPESIHGGERAFLYQYVEDFLFTFGMDGKGCLLRAICEMHESPLLGYGLVGELINIFLTPSRSSYQSRMAEYINAEETGKKEGDCFKFERDCSKSLFKTSKYSKEANQRSEMSRATLEQLVGSQNPVDNEVM